ncbi:MAG: hypothetical protein JNL59_07055, partial [Chitinophagaceae bacterium]|nr:hypothetical protein [Chitinophagaceae bacterium]
MATPRITLLFICLFIYLQTIAQDRRDFMPVKRAIDRGYHYLGKFNAPEAMKYFGLAVQEAKQLKSNYYYASALFGMGQAIWYAFDFKHAADTIELAIRYFPVRYKSEIIGAYRILSNIYDDMGEYESAFKAVQTALSMNAGEGENNTVLPLVQLGRLY